MSICWISRSTCRERHESAHGANLTTKHTKKYAASNSLLSKYPMSYFVCFVYFVVIHPPSPPLHS